VQRDLSQFQTRSLDPESRATTFADLTAPLQRGRSAATELFRSQAKLYSLDDPEHPQVEAGADALTVERIERRPGTSTIRVEVTLWGALKRYWLEIQGTPATYAVYLATDAADTTRYILELDMVGRNDAGLFQIDRMDAALSRLNPKPLGTMAAFDRKVDEGGWLPARAPEPALFDKDMDELSGTPLAALIRLLTEFRFGLVQVIKDWPDRLAARYPKLPDWTVLALHQKLFSLRGRAKAPEG
jgi:hypothetical protein